jgi:glucosamine--fructose-6-phosphate aminotransferase (isomerizing)
MLKEIAEQPAGDRDTLLGRLSERGDIVLDEVRLTDQDLRDVDKVFIIACGTSYHAGMVAKYAIEHWVRIPCEVELASEFRYRDPILDRSTLVIAISQSGETMDTLMALRTPRSRRPRAGDLQHQRLDDPARVGRGALHARAARDRGGLDQGVRHPAGRLLPDRPAPRADPRRDVRRRGRGRGGEAAAHPGQPPQLLGQMEEVRELARDLKTRRRCSSSAGTSATRWRSRAR